MLAHREEVGGLQKQLETQIDLSSKCSSKVCACVGVGMCTLINALCVLADTSDGKGTQTKRAQSQGNTEKPGN